MVSCKEIPIEPILRLLLDGKPRHAFEIHPHVEPERSIFHGFPPGTPGKVGLAKMAKLIKQKLVDGCACGCAGNFLITDKGRRYLEKTANGEVNE